MLVKMMMIDDTDDGEGSATDGTMSDDISDDEL